MKNRITPFLLVCFLIAFIVQCSSQDQHQNQKKDSIQIGDFIGGDNTATDSIVLDSTYLGINIIDDDYIIRMNEVNMVGGTIYLMDLYMEEIEKDSVHIGWRFIFDETERTKVFRPLYYSKYAIHYLAIYDYDNKYRGGSLYHDAGVHENPTGYNYILRQYEIDKYIRAEKIIVPRRPSFEHFHKWAMEYYKAERMTKRKGVKFDY
jgi:hypothetical protein